MQTKSRLTKISIISHALSAGGGISVGRNFIQTLIQNLPDKEFQLFVPAGLDYESGIPQSASVESFFYQKSSMLKRAFFDHFIVERKLGEFSPDLTICLGNRGVAYNRGKQFILCHDSHLFYPVTFYARELFSKKLLKWFQRGRLASDLKNTDVLFCQTEVAAKRLQQMFGFDGPIRILPNAVSMDVMKASNGISIPECYYQNDDKLRLFYLTRYYPHKNIELLVDLFAQYRHQLADVRLFLTIDSNQHPLASKLLSKIDKLKLQEQIVNLGPLSQSELPGYFSHAHALIMPTTLESFSGTYLEAMSFGCPIITSDLDFAHDICGDAALYFDPWSVDSLFNVLNRFIYDNDIKLELANRGKLRLSQLGNTWDQNGEILLNTIRQYFIV